MFCQPASCLQLYELGAEFRRWTAGRRWSKFVQNCTLVSEITLTSRKLCLFCGKRPFFSPFLASPIPEGVRLMNNKAEQSQQNVLIQMYNMSCVECSWLIRGVNPPKQVTEQCWPFSLQRHDRWCPNFNPRSWTACKSESFFDLSVTVTVSKHQLETLNPPKKVPPVHRAMIWSPEKAQILKICSVHMHYRCTVANRRQL